MTIEMILDIIRDYQFNLECIMDYTENKREFTRSDIKHDAASELSGIFIRKWEEYKNENTY